VTRDLASEFASQKVRNIEALGTDQELQKLSLHWITETARNQYSYNFTALGRPIIQFPQDMIALQEIIWDVRPDLIIETGIAHGGSLIWNASMLALLEYCDAASNHQSLDPSQPTRRVVGVDIDIRAHNRSAIEAHPMANRIDMIQGSSIDAGVIRQVQNIARRFERVLVILDSNHTHDHVLAELEAYAPLTSVGSYCIVFDTVVENLPESMYPDRPWGKGDNPKTAVTAYLRELEHPGRTAEDGQAIGMEIDRSVEHKLLITVAPDGYLRRTH